MPGRRRPLRWLLAAATLFALAAWVARSCGGTEQVAQRAPPELPRQLRPAEARRMERRQTLLPASPQQPGRPRDPLLAALSAPDAGTALVFEANALRHSPVGQLLLDCLELSQSGADGGPSPLDALRALGIDPLQDVDRVAMGDDDVVVSGDFSRARWDALFAGTTPAPYGSQGQLYRLSAADGGTGPVMAAWGNQLLVVSSDEAAARASLDRVEGRGLTGGGLTDAQAYGDVYGTLGGEQLAALFEPANDSLSAQVRNAAKRVELHLDATRDVGLVAQVTGDDASRLELLGKALGGTLAAARARALASGDTESAELLEFARVVPGGESFSLELAVPFEVLQARLAFCGRAARGDAGR
jgi:hypothetical protein